MARRALGQVPLETKVTPEKPDIFDLIVVGAGHAGCEAALAAARLGASCLLATINLDHLAALSCNPAVGGLAKGHLVREIDALGGEMAKQADAVGIQFRLLNKGKGPAVWSSRAQVDIDLYPRRMLKVCKSQENLWLLDAEVLGLVVEKGRAAGVTTAKGPIPARSVLLTTGTFLRGVIHQGLEQTPAGRLGDPPSNALSDQLKKLGFNLGRLKTGTTPRLLAKSLDLNSLPEQTGDETPRMFSFLNKKPALAQVSCRISRTGAATHAIIRENLKQAPMYAGVITGVGARYCPSIEDKVVRFPDKDGHQIFLEPQGLENGLVYPNGISTGLPLKVQIPMIRTLEGCSRAEIVHPGYAIEYDYSDPLDLTLALMSKKMPGLFMAGQINGTSGYEEAAAQGLMAGLNAVRWVRGEKPFILDRSRAYIGVLIDDLVTKGTGEPYRMFTSRAEYRLTLREDNADLRLTALGRDMGLVDDERWRVFSRKKDQLDAAWQLLTETGLTPNAKVNERMAGLGQSPLIKPQSAAELLRRPGLGLGELISLDERLAGLDGLDEAVAEQLEIRSRYQGYEEREHKQVARFREQEAMTLPPDFAYRGIPGLSVEVQQKLERIRPSNLGQAGRISGVTPAALAVLGLKLHQLASGK